MRPLHEQQCDGDATAMPLDESRQMMQHLHADWALSNHDKAISRVFKFSNYYETMAFANVVAMIAHQQDHHPDMTIGYNTCLIVFSTHSVAGLSSYDFISAAKVDRINAL